jgi:hypothetical protein
MNEAQAALLDLAGLLCAFGVWRIAFILSGLSRRVEAKSPPIAPRSVEEVLQGNGH